MRTCINDNDILNYVRVISITKSKKLHAELAGGAPLRVVKTLCNFCSNALYNTAIRYHVDKCASLRRNKSTIKKLSTRRVSIAEKRRTIRSLPATVLRDLITVVSNGLGENINDVISH
jgi:hypothetical protein